MSRIGAIVLVVFAASILAGCGEDTYKADPATAPKSPKGGGKPEKDG